jgi:hypothetical protein
MLIKKVLQSRKAEGLNIGTLSVYLIIFGIMLAFMVLILVFYTDKYVNSFMAYHPDLPNHIYAYRAINTCLAYQDNVTSRYYPGVIDFTKYTQEALEKCYVDTQVRSFNVQLRDLDRQKDYDRILVGFGASLKIMSYPVAIKYPDGAMSKGELLFGIS